MLSYTKVSDVHSDTEVLLIVRADKREVVKPRKLGELVNIYVGKHMPPGLLHPPRFLFLADGRWEDYVTTPPLGRSGFVPLSKEELRQLNDPNKYVLIGPKDEMQGGTELYALYRKRPTYF